ncbi:MAG: ankyrin repeat domain-containing protein [Gammaproteobacteria bacterium]|nr:MAG: ankyrin repeat domain-containing protein [Gammaproteobacteria bacterium]
MMSNAAKNQRRRGNAEVTFLAVCGLLACVSIVLMLRHAEDFDPLLDVVRSEWSALNEEFERTLEAIGELFSAAPPAAPGDEELPALSVAARDGNGPVLLRLLAGGADVNVTDDEARTPLMHAAEAGRNVITRLLLEAGADREMRDASGRTAADWARQEGHAELAELLEPDA